MFAASKTASVSTAYQISRSLRFNRDDSPYLIRTATSAGNRRKWTFSAWVKKSYIGDQKIFSAGTGTTDQTYFQLYFGSADTIRADGYSGGFLSTASISVYRDYSAWYHIVLAADTDNATPANRLQLYVNGSLVTTGNVTGDTAVNSIDAFNIGRNGLSGGSGYFGGYMTEINLIDGQALTPSSFGATNAQTGVWGPIAYGGTYGTNGFYLNFSDNSNTTAATLGKDYSGNGNNFTPNNFSVTAGAGNDSLVDSPTSYGADNGVGGNVRGNYCTWNPLDKNASVSTLNGNLDAYVASGSWFSVRATFGMSSGKWYWECTPDSNTAALIGIGLPTASLATYVGGDAFGWSYFSSNGNKFNNNTSVAYGAGYTTNDVVGIAFDADNGTLTFYKNGTSQGTAYTGLTSGPYFPMVGLSGPLTLATNFGQRPFAYTAPSGYKALCTQNLPTPTVGATTATQAGKFFNPVLYTGNGTGQSITGVGFQPDLVWVKSRSGTTDHAWYDAVRGVQKQIESNTGTAETTETTGLTAFGSDGFTTGLLLQLNTISATYVAWNWKANGAGSSNTSGSITSTVSASTISGFSVVTYTGTGANATVGHGLGVAPSMIIVKSRSQVVNWLVWHTSLPTPSTAYLLLNLTDASANAPTTVWNSTVPTSSVFSLGTNVSVNNSASTYVAYCFAEVAGYSKFGSYTGNGSTDGPFVYTGMRPAYVMIKRTDSTSDWYIWDTKRDTYNAVGNTLLADTAGAETSATSIDDLSNGFKCRSATVVNVSSGTYIYMAFAESPFKYSLAR